LHFKCSKKFVLASQNSMQQKSTIFFWLFALTIFQVLIATPLFMDGMFCDALLYTSASHNLAQGMGTFWFPFLSPQTSNGICTFHEQPPLLIFIESIFYKIFGLGIYTERIYVLCCFVFTAFLMYKIWQLVQDKFIAKSSYLPITLFIICPTVFWSYTNAIQEVGMGVFTTWAVYLLLKNLLQNSHNWWRYCAAGLLIVAASMSKGVPGLFPLAVPFVFWLVYRNVSFIKMLGTSFYLLLVNIICYFFFIFSSNEACNSLHIYFFEKLLARVNNAPTVTNRFDVFLKLGQDVLPWIAIIFLVFLLLKKQKIALINKPQKQNILLLLVIGLCGVLPLSLTKVQRDFYYLPALPILALSAALFLQNALHYILNKFRFHKQTTSIVLVSILFTCSSIYLINNIGKPKRDHTTLHDLYAIKKAVPTFSEFSVRQPLWDNWGLHQYYIRYLNINFNIKDSNLKYFLIYKNETPPSDTNFKDMGLELTDITLFERINDK
jgi:4-amino-4-deoxy-L-arabinose transferase-like glycosyltransferase